MNTSNLAQAGFFIAKIWSIPMNFADPIDEAAAREQQMIELALANRHSAPHMVYTGECHYCEEPIANGHFCNSDCRDDHAKFVRAGQQRANHAYR